MSETISAEELLSKVWAMKERLKKAGIEAQIRGYCFGRISIIAHTGIEWWEIDFDQNGDIRFERYVSSGLSENPEQELEKLILETEKINQEDIERLNKLHLQ
jgi:hypothetical protein